MNFFKSILLDEENPPNNETPQNPDPISPSKPSNHDPISPSSPNPNPNNTSTWGFGFGGLIKTLASQSESVIETYRRDLKEFGSGLQKETHVIREAATRAVKDLPASIEAGTSAAQGVLDGVLKSTADIISKESQVFSYDGEQPVTPDTKNSGRYSWFEAQLSVIQSDLSTYVDEPEDVEEFRKWKLGFDLESRKAEIGSLIGEDGILEGVYKRVVGGGLNGVDEETFWFRYFYRVEKLVMQEKVRANLVKRAIEGDDEDELSWDVDDDEFEDGGGSEVKGIVKKEGVSGERLDLGEKGEVLNSGLGDDKVGDDKGTDNVVEERKKSSEGVKEMKSVEAPVITSDDKVESEKEIKSEEALTVKTDEKVESEKEIKSKEATTVKTDDKVKSEESVEKKNNEKNVSVEEKGDKNDVSDDIGWDEIEDTESGDEKKISSTIKDGSPNRDELRKRLSADDDDEDLSWDIEDDDDPVKT